jgi:lipopolysaccharide transport system permease protein
MYQKIIRNFQELYRFRALLKALIVRFITIRYRGSVLGFLWSLLNPLCLMLVYTLVFHFYIRFDSGENYALFLFCGLLPWIWTASALAESASAIVNNGHLITKSAFPAHILPTVAIGTNFINFLLSLPILGVFLIINNKSPNSAWFALPIIFVLNFIFLYGLGLVVASLNVIYRDVQHIVANLLSFLFFLCPIVYSIKVIPKTHLIAFTLNPLSLFTLGYQRIWLEGKFYSLGEFSYLVGICFFVLLLGICTYEYFKETFAELL